MRAADADRERVVEILQEAFAQGRITVDEFHERSDQAYAAKTLGELTPITADLPVQDLARKGGPSASGAVAQGTRFGSGSWSPAVAGRTSVERRRQLKAIWATWITITTITTIIWLASCVTSSSLEPFWPIWPIGFLGAGAALRTFGITSHQNQRYDVHDQHGHRHDHHQHGHNRSNVLGDTPRDLES
jgi:hypothetical protein